MALTKFNKSLLFATLFWHIPELISSMLIAVAFSFSPPQGDAFASRAYFVPMDSWQAEEGDAFVADIANSVGYLVHRSGDYTSFPIISGRRRVVRYIGRTYNASTPIDHWTVLSKEKKGDRVTFGPEGLFLRLYRGNKQVRSPYGIHGHKYEKIMFERSDAYQSMGCIIVRKPILDIIEETFVTNGGKLDVVTVDGLEQNDEVALQVSPLSSKP